MTHGDGKSDTTVVPKKLPNKAEEPAAEAVEGRAVAEGKTPKRNTLRTQSREGVPSTLERIRVAARQQKQLRFTALVHHVYDVERLRQAYFALKREAAAGVDGETWKHYGEQLGENLQDLSQRLQRGAYRAKPVRRAYIEKADGRQRPLGVPVLEDKIVQRAVVEVLSAIYEQDFAKFSCGFRPGRGPHDALNALTVAIQTRKVSWVLDADIKSFFDTLQHSWLVKFVEPRVADRRIVRLIQKWLRAGVLEEGRRTRSGDCNADLTVTVDAVIRGLSVALGTTDIGECHEADVNGDWEVSVDKVVTAINAALSGVPGRKRLDSEESLLYLSLIYNDPPGSAHRTVDGHVGPRAGPLVDALRPVRQRLQRSERGEAAFDVTAAADSDSGNRRTLRHSDGLHARRGALASRARDAAKPSGTVPTTRRSA